MGVPTILKYPKNKLNSASVTVTYLLKVSNDLIVVNDHPIISKVTVRKEET